MRHFLSPIDFLQRVWSYGYRHTLRHLMPRRPLRYAGVAIDRDRKYGDILIPGYISYLQLNDIADYEEALIRGLNMSVKQGMTVVIIGGGIGITSVIAANLAGPEGKVICFEGSQTMVARIQEVARRNSVSNQIQVHYGVVGPAIGVYHGEGEEAPRINPNDLPECDVLEMDCEGSEKVIISNLSHRPARILVETHGINGAPTDQIRKLLKMKGYETSDLGPAEPRFQAFCIKNDIRVIVADYKGAMPES